jgi:hypothetical protein
MGAALLITKTSGEIGRGEGDVISRIECQAVINLDVYVVVVHLDTVMMDFIVLL